MPNPWQVALDDVDTAAVNKARMPPTPSCFNRVEHLNSILSAHRELRPVAVLRKETFQDLARGSECTFPITLRVVPVTLRVPLTLRVGG